MQRCIAFADEYSEEALAGFLRDRNFPGPVIQSMLDELRKYTFEVEATFSPMGTHRTHGDPWGPMGPMGPMWSHGAR